LHGFGEIGMKNTLGNNLLVTLFGESHGPYIGAVLDGLAPGIVVDEDFIRSLELSYNNNVIDNPLTKEDFEINNFNNWEARNDIEKYLEKLLLDELGQFTSIKDLVEMFKVSKTIWYEALEEGKIMYFTISTRKIVVTRSLLPFLREAMSDQY